MLACVLLMHSWLCVCMMLSRWSIFCFCNGRTSSEAYPPLTAGATEKKGAKATQVMLDWLLTTLLCKKTFLILGAAAQPRWQSC